MNESKSTSVQKKEKTHKKRRHPTYIPRQRTRGAFGQPPNSHQLVCYSDQGLRKLRERLHEVTVAHYAVGQESHPLQQVVPRLGRRPEVTGEPELRLQGGKSSFACCCRLSRSWSFEHTVWCLMVGGESLPTTDRCFLCCFLQSCWEHKRKR